MPTLTLSADLKGAIDRAVTVATSAEQGGKKILVQSLTQFDNPTELTLEIGEPRLEYARALLWSREELKSRVSDTVITIHDQFAVPLFFLETPPESRQRDLDFLAIRRNNGNIAGKINSRTAYGAPYRLSELARGIVPGVGFAVDAFWQLLRHENLMFAKDARVILT